MEGQREELVACDLGLAGGRLFARLWRGRVAVQSVFGEVAQPVAIGVGERSGVLAVPRLVAGPCGVAGGCGDRERDLRRADGRAVAGSEAKNVGAGGVCRGSGVDRRCITKGDVARAADFFPKRGDGGGRVREVVVGHRAVERRGRSGLHGRRGCDRDDGSEIRRVRGVKLADFGGRQCAVVDAKVVELSAPGVVAAGQSADAKRGGVGIGSGWHLGEGRPIVIVDAEIPFAVGGLEVIHQRDEVPVTVVERRGACGGDGLRRSAGIRLDVGRRGRPCFVAAARPIVFVENGLVAGRGGCADPDRDGERIGARVEVEVGLVGRREAATRGGVDVEARARLAGGCPRRAAVARDGVAPDRVGDRRAAAFVEFVAEDESGCRPVARAGRAADGDGEVLRRREKSVAGGEAQNVGAVRGERRGGVGRARG